MQLIRSICVSQVSDDEKYTVGVWKLIHICFYKEFRFLKLDAHIANLAVGEENDQFTKLKFSSCLKVQIRSS
jgi:hypothetical protein